MKCMKKDREPSLLRQIITIHYEQALRRRAIRQLSKVDWSLEFLTEVIRHSAEVMKKDIVIELETKAGHKMTLSSVKNRSNDLNADDDIFNHLDDEAAVQRFIRENSVRG